MNPLDKEYHSSFQFPDFLLGSGKKLLSRKPLGGPGTQFKGPLRGSRAPGAWGYHQTRGHQNIITSLTLPFCNVECFMVSTVCTVACVVSIEYYCLLLCCVCISTVTTACTIVSTAREE